MNTSEHNRSVSAEAWEFNAFVNAPAALGILTLESFWLRLNLVFCKLLGYEESELVGSHLGKIVSPEDGQGMFASVNEMVTGISRSAQFEVQLLCRNGSTINALFNASSVLDQSQTPIYFVVHIQDLARERRHSQVQQVFRALGNKLLSAITPNQVATHMLDAADELFQWGCAFIDLYSEETGKFESLLTIDELDGKRVAFKPEYESVVPGSKTQQALETGAFLLLREPEADVPALSVISFGNNRLSASLMYVPMRRGECNVGVMSIQSYRYYAYSEADLNLLQVLADYCSTSFERTFAESKAAQAEAILLESQKRFDLVMRATNDAIYDLDIVSGETWWNESARLKFCNQKSDCWNGDWWKEQIYADDRARTVTDMYRAMEQGEQSWVCEYRFQLANGDYGDFLDRGFITYEDGRAIRMIGSMMDITARKRAEEQLRHGAYHDALTGLPNRAMVIEELNRSLARSKRRDDFNIGLLFLDLDRFKMVNDSLGHSAGDQLLVQVAGAIKDCLRPSDLVGRLGGDEFIVLLDDLSDEQAATTVAERILKCLQLPFSIENNDVFTGTSIGIALSSSRYTNADEMLRDADTAMYRAKVAGKGRFEIFDMRMHAKVVSALQTENDLRRAIQLQQFVLHYQPLLDLQTRSIIGFEALVRWNHPERGLFPPSEFITVAEETGLISSIGEWVLRTACAEALTWETPANGKPLEISVNVSARQFNDPTFISAVEAILEETGLEPRRLNLEITESLLMEASAQRTDDFHRLKRMGVNFHLDDFGTGYSSLSYLHRYPIDVLKIDRSFVSRFDTDVESREIVRAILAMARVLNLSVVGEGIETEAQLQLLKDFGCDAGQGYFFHKPLTTAALKAVLAAT